MVDKGQTLPANRLKKQREKIGVSQEVVADLLGVHRATVGRWETSEIPMPKEKQVEAWYWLRDGGPLDKRKKDLATAARKRGKRAA